MTTHTWYNTRFGKVIWWLEGCISECPAQLLKWSLLVSAPMAPLFYRLVFTGLQCQTRNEWGNKSLCRPIIVALTGQVWKHEARLWLVQTKHQLKCFNQQLGNVGWGRAKAVLSDKTSERSEDDQRQTGLNSRMKWEKCKTPCWYVFDLMQLVNNVWMAVKTKSFLKKSTPNKY